MTNQPLLYALRFEHYSSALGIGHATPRISWRYGSQDDDYPKNWTQRAYEVEIARGGESAQSHHVESKSSVLVPWPSTPLRSRESARMRVRAYGHKLDTATEWSAWETVEAGLLDVKDWTAKPISKPIAHQPEGPLRPTRFRKSFELDGKSSVSKARLYATAWGVYEIYINGTRIGKQIMAPGWTSYKHRLLYQVYDVPTSLLRADGQNVIAVEVGEGWYAGRLGFNGGKRYIYGDRLASLVQLEISSEDGKELQIIRSDHSWECMDSAILSSEIYDGEVYDMAQEKDDWNKPGSGDDASWLPVEELPLSLSVLQAQEAPPVSVTEKINPQAIFESPSGKTIVDFGQNLVGQVCVRRLKQTSGSKLTITHAEVLENGEVSTRPLRQAKCTDTIIMSDQELLDWTPKFTFHGFRYIQIEGWEAGMPNKTDLVAHVMHTDMHRTGYFSCSDDKINQLHKNVVWSMRGNFLSIPTDCPQRDERLGWTGDIQAFCPSANFLYDTASMMGSWLQDLSDEQLNDEPNCTPGVVVPNILQDTWPSKGLAIWQDVAVLTPRDLHRTFGDEELLRRQYKSMKGWIDQGITRGPDGLWDPEYWQLGDWLDPAAPADEPSKGRTDGVYVADAYLVHVTTALANISQLLNFSSDAEKYAQDAAKFKDLFQQKYITPLGNVVADTQTALSLAICFNLFSKPAQEKAAGIRLSRLVRASRFRISTGFAGTPLITHALVKSGQPQLAYRMLQEEQCPSWLYPVTMGATTVWERWDSLLPDGSVNPGEMTSFNHFSLGAVVDFLHTTVGGIAPLEPGWKVVKVNPVPGGRVTSADVQFEGPYGVVECSWTLKGTNFEMRVDVPPNSSALVVLPGQSLEEGKTVGSGRYTFETEYDVGEWPEAMFDPFCAPDVKQ